METVHSKQSEIEPSHHKQEAMAMLHFGVLCDCALEGAAGDFHIERRKMYGNTSIIQRSRGFL